MSKRDSRATAGGLQRACTRQNGAFLADGIGFRTPCEKTIPLTRPLRVLGEGDAESCGMGHDVSLTAGEERTWGRTWMGIIRP
jgi:hypothetical protein